MSSVGSDDDNMVDGNNSMNDPDFHATLPPVTYVMKDLVDGCPTASGSDANDPPSQVDAVAACYQFEAVAAMPKESIDAVEKLSSVFSG